MVCKFRCRDSNSDKIIIGLVVSYKQREPKLLLRLSENGGYLSRSAISCMTVAMRHWALYASAFPTRSRISRGPQ